MLKKPSKKDLISRKSMKNPYSWQVSILPILFIILTAAGLSSLNIYELQQEKKEQIENVTAAFIDQQKKTVRDRVMMTSELILFQHSQTLDLVRKRVKDRVDEAIYICNVFYGRIKMIYLRNS